MNSKTSIALIIFSTLAIGVVLGFVGRGIFIKDRTSHLGADERMEFFSLPDHEAIEADSAQAPHIDRSFIGLQSTSRFSSITSRGNVSSYRFDETRSRARSPAGADPTTGRRITIQ